MCQFCPLATDTSFPTEDRFVDRDGFPNHVDISFETSKGRRGRDKKDKFRLARNYVDQRFCPVFFLALWLATSRIKTGPLFPRLRRNGKEVAVAHSFWINPRTNIKHWHDTKGEDASMTYEMLLYRFKKLFKKAGYENANPYTIRKSATKWAARCGAEQFQVVSAGRWEDFSRHFLSYIEAGVLEGQDAGETPAEDPIRKLWVFYPTAVMDGL